MNVPYVRQTVDYDCGPAALAMLLLFWQVEVPYEKLLELTGAHPKRGTSALKMIRTLRKLGFEVKAGGYTNIREVRRAIYAGEPVIVNCRDPEDGCGHYLVVTAMEGQMMTLHDPWHGPDIRMTVRQFKQRWLHHSHSVNWALFARPKKKRT